MGLKAEKGETICLLLKPFPNFDSNFESMYNFHKKNIYI